MTYLKTSHLVAAATMLITAFSPATAADLGGPYPGSLKDPIPYEEWEPLPPQACQHSAGIYAGGGSAWAGDHNIGVVNFGYESMFANCWGVAPPAFAIFGIDAAIGVDEDSTSSETYSGTPGYNFRFENELNSFTKVTGRAGLGLTLSPRIALKGGVEAGYLGTTEDAQSFTVKGNKVVATGQPVQYERDGLYAGVFGGAELLLTEDVSATVTGTYGDVVVGQNDYSDGVATVTGALKFRW